LKSRAIRPYSITDTVSPRSEIWLEEVDPP